MGIVSVEQADHLYWLGRYSERVYTTLRYYFQRFDEMIDETIDSYEKYCTSVDIPNIYTSKEDFCGAILLMKEILIPLSAI